MSMKESKDGDSILASMTGLSVSNTRLPMLWEFLKCFIFSLKLGGVSESKFWIIQIMYYPIWPTMTLCRRMLNIEINCFTGIVTPWQYMRFGETRQIQRLNKNMIRSRLDKECGSTNCETEDGDQVGAHHTSSSSFRRIRGGSGWRAICASLCWAIAVPMITMRLASHWLGRTGGSWGDTCCGFLTGGCGCGCSCCCQCGTVAVPTSIISKMKEKAWKGKNSVLPVIPVRFTANRSGRRRAWVFSCSCLSNGARGQGNHGKKSEFHSGNFSKIFIVMNRNALMRPGLPILYASQTTSFPIRS